MLSRLLLTTLVFLVMAVNATGVDDKPERTPTEFEIQILEPTGGKIAKPTGWHYAQEQRGPVYLWTLSREKSVGKP